MVDANPYSCRILEVNLDLGASHLTHICRMTVKLFFNFRVQTYSPWAESLLLENVQELG